MSYLWSTLKALARILTVPALRALGGLLSSVSLPLARALAGVAMIIAAVALAHDLGPVTIGRPADFKPTAVVTHWQQLAPASLTAARTFTAQRLGPWVWSAVAAPMALPTFVVFTALGVLFGFLGRHRNRIEIFAN